MNWVRCDGCKHFVMSAHSKQGIGKCKRGMSTQDYKDYQSNKRFYVLWRIWAKPHYPKAWRICDERRELEGETNERKRREK